jgi:hypothetical protein
VDGDIGYRHHKEGHTDTPDRPIFVEFASRYMNDNWPVVPAGQSFTLGAATVNVVGQVTAGDPDAGDVLGNWQVKGGTGVGLFTIDRQTGLVNIANAAGIDFAATPSYSLIVTVSDGTLTSKHRVVTMGRRCRSSRWTCPITSGTATASSSAGKKSGSVSPLPLQIRHPAG